MSTPKGKLIIFSAPSGSGKSTLVQYLLTQVPGFAFSISATSRAPRGAEKDGVDYYFLSLEEFQQRVAEEAFLEWEEVYPGQCYGTLKSEVEKSWSVGDAVAFDIDVVGGKNLKADFGDQALALFIQAPSIEELERRLVARGTDSPEKIKLRIEKASWEMNQSEYFDHIIINDDLDRAKAEAKKLLVDFLAK
ncbi:guanylate kinase [Schleiferiaceae bacterium]|nr:guanylate kinase [Schleiferiaceae bacterium]MDA8564754.1 guanylate kinase [Schleiferiaceae bacterium]MDA9191696.1 guanylate kinase [Schleiferiaceae bacterium]